MSMIESDPAVFEALMQTHLMSFLHRCFIELNPGQQLSRAPHLEIMAGKLAACLSGRGRNRLIINLPPRSLKSITVSVALAAWALGLDPTRQLICVSYGQELANKHARDTKTIMTSSFYQEVFPETRLSPQKLSVHDFMTTKYGFRMATSVGGVLTGRGGDILILDDPLKPDEALSEVKRTAVKEWYDNTLLSRLNNKSKGIIIIVMQRLHQDDLVGHVLEQGDEWDILCFPAIAPEDERHTVDTPYGEYVFERKAGEVLDPSRESLDTLLAMKELIGTYNFSSQYQQDPAPPGGAMVKTDWLQYYDPAGALPTFSTVLQSWDTAIKSGDLNHYSVCTTWGVHDGRYYLLDVLRKRLNYPELKAAVLEQIKKGKPRTVIIEDKASGTQLIQELKYVTNCRVQGYDPPPKADKVMRVHSQTAKFESGSVLLPSVASWLAEYVKELTAFPGAKFDDQVDSTTQALDYMSKNDEMEVWTKLGRGY